MASASSPLLVTGASGHLGRRVLSLLLERNAGPLIATTRNPDGLADFAARGVDVRRADFDDETTLADAFRGAERALLISTDALDRPGRRVAQQTAAVRALEAAGVKHVVYTSASGKDVDPPFFIIVDHRATERAIAATALDFTILRDNLYSELLLQSAPQAIASGQLVDARGDGAVAWVTREDCARAAAAALASSASGRRTLDITGPAAVTSAEVAAILGEIAGKSITHVSIPAAALQEAMVKQGGLPPQLAAMLAAFDAAIANGTFPITSESVRELTGSAPQSVRDFLVAHRAVLTGA